MAFSTATRPLAFGTDPPAEKAKAPTKGRTGLAPIASPLSPTKSTWGRAATGRSWLRSMVGASPMILAPLATLCFYVALAEFDGSLLALTRACYTDGFLTVLWEFRPHFEATALFVYLGWVAVQAVLYHVLPGEVKTGQLTPAGHLLSYRMNGFPAWVVTHVGVVALCYAGLLDPGFIPRHWSGLFFAVNLCGFAVTALSYLKALVWPTHPDDRKFSGKLEEPLASQILARRQRSPWVVRRQAASLTTFTWVSS